MNPRVIIAGVFGLACLVGFVAVGRQRQQLAELRAEEQRLRVAIEANEAAPAQAETAVSRDLPTTRSAGPPPEMLELRSEVTRLMGRQRELTGAGRENEQLRAQLAAKGTNSLATPILPPGYILKSKAQWKGLNTPEDTLQSFLWAAQNRDLTNLMQTLTPELAQQVLAATQQAGRAGGGFLKELETLPGMRVVGRTQESNGRVSLEVEFVPGMPDSFRFRQVNGQWKMDMR